MAQADSQLKVKLFSGSNLSLLEQLINEWLASESRPIVQRSELASDGSQFVISVWYQQQEW